MAGDVSRLSGYARAEARLTVGATGGAATAAAGVGVAERWRLHIEHGDRGVIDLGQAGLVDLQPGLPGAPSNGSSTSEDGSRNGGIFCADGQRFRISDGDFSSSVVDMVVSDHFLQGGTGIELATAMKKLKPDVPIVIISGLVDAPEGMEHADLFICKGNSATEFLQKISELLSSRD